MQRACAEFRLNEAGSCVLRERCGRDERVDPPAHSVWMGGSTPCLGVSNDEGIQKVVMKCKSVMRWRLTFIYLFVCLFLFLLDKTLSVFSDNCRAMGRRMAGGGGGQQWFWEKRTSPDEAIPVWPG